MSETQSTVRYLRKRDNLIAAATPILNRNGIKGMTLAGVAEQVGLITTSVTYYFRKKEDLAVACFLSGIERIEAILKIAEIEEGHAARLSAVLRLSLELVQRIRLREEPPLPIFTDLAILAEPHRSAVTTPFGEMVRHTRRVIRPDGDPAWRDAAASIGRTHLTLSQLLRIGSWIGRYESEDFPRLQDQFSDMIMHGLAAPGEAWPDAELPGFAAWRATQDDAPAEAFLRAATALISRRGYHGASVDKIAAELNVTKGSFYHHNTGKDELVAACFQRSFDVVKRAQTEAAAMEGSRFSRLARATSALMELHMAESGLLLSRTAINALPQDMRGRVIERFYRVIDRFAAMVSDGVADGSIRPVDPVIAANLICTAINSAPAYLRFIDGLEAREGSVLYARPVLMGVYGP